MGCLGRSSLKVRGSQPYYSKLMLLFIAVEEAETVLVLVLIQYLFS